MLATNASPASTKAPPTVIFDAPAVAAVAVAVEEVLLAVEALVALLAAVVEAGPSQCLFHILATPHSNRIGINSPVISVRLASYRLSRARCKAAGARLVVMVLFFRGG